MDKTEIINIVNEFATKVAEKYDCVSIVLFGSYAKGSYHIDSDIDIAVILKDYDNLMNIQLELMKLRRKIDNRIEPHPIKESDFNEGNPLVNEIKKYGKTININVA
ncbi:MAG: nucleotidyltransferase domain-containing protein [Bacteroidales bacterium]|nr:nucleotidyltransferase domain-containing protein [Bacteroidales bacterium]